VDEVFLFTSLRLSRGIEEIMAQLPGFFFKYSGSEELNPNKLHQELPTAEYLYPALCQGGRERED